MHGFNYIDEGPIPSAIKDKFGADVKIYLSNNEDINYIKVLKQGKYFLLDCKCETVLTEGYDEILLADEVPANILFSDREKMHDDVYTNQFSLVHVESNKDLVIVKSGSKYGMFQADGREVLPVQCEKIIWISTDRVITCMKGKYGLWDTKGTCLIPCIYDKIRPIPFIKQYGYGYDDIYRQYGEEIKLLAAMSKVEDGYVETGFNTSGETVISPCLSISLGEYYSIIETFYEFPYICAEVYTNLILETAPRRYCVVDLKALGFDYSEYREDYDDCSEYVCGKIVPDGAEEASENIRSIFFIIDSSGGMTGYWIYCINQIFRKLVSVLKEPEESGGNKKYMINVLKYSSDVRWMYDEPVDADGFSWKDIETGGVVSLGEAFSELDDRLSPDEFMKPSTQDRPCIVLLSYRQPTDEHFNKLQELNKNLWFKDAEKYAFAMSDHVDSVLLTMFTGNREHVFETDDNEILEEKLTDIVRRFKAGK